MKSSLHKYFIVFFSIVSIIVTSCNLFSLRQPDISGEENLSKPLTFLELISTFRQGIEGSNINLYEVVLGDSFRFRVCDRIYYTDPSFYTMWNRNIEIEQMQNLFLSLSMNKDYPVLFKNFTISFIDSSSVDSQYARIEYLVYFSLHGNEVDTARGILEFYGMKKNEYWQVDLIKDHEVNEVTCLSDIKVRFLSGK